jgi:hypothetical protein
MKVMEARQYKRTLDNLRERYLDVLAERNAMTIELAGLARSIEGLAALCGEEPTVPSADPHDTNLTKAMAEAWLKYMGFADACRTALKIVAPSALTTSDIREMLTRAGYPIERRTDPMVSINVCMHRLVKAEEVEPVVLENGHKAFRWAFRNELPQGYQEGLQIWNAIRARKQEGGNDG